jgi:hypothetical protein
MITGANKKITLKTVLPILSLFFILSCKCDRDEDYVRGIRMIKKEAIRYADSINKLSKEPVKK